MAKKFSSAGLRRTTALSLMGAIVVVLTVLQNFVKFGPFPITLALAPIIVGGALFGPSAGALLGTVFGLVTVITGILGWDGGSVMLLMGVNPIACVLGCVLKGTLAGLFSAWAYKFVSKKGSLAGVIGAGIVCPVVNTGVFVLVMLLFFFETLKAWSGGTALMSYILFGLAGVNFLVELTVNMVLASGITEIIRYAGRGRK